MTDVVVPTEQEMAHIRSLFTKAADAIVQASTLGQRVAELEQSQQRMKHELEQVRNTNTWLSEQLGATRVERDNLSRDLSVMQREHNETKQQVEELRARLDERDATIEKLREQLKAEQDSNVELLERAFKAEDELAKVRAKLAEAKEWLKGIGDSIGAKLEQPEEVAAHTPPTPVEQREPDHVPTSTEEVGEPSGEEKATGTHDPYRW